MDRRSFKKRKTAQRFGACKPKPPIVKKKFSPATSASSDDGVQHDEDLQPSTSTHGASSASIDETVDMPLEQCFVPSEETFPRFVSAEASLKRAAAVQESLRAVSATQRKMSLMDQGDESDIETEDENEFFLVQRPALNGLLGSALCPQCKEPGLKMKHGTKHRQHDEVEDMQRAIMATFYHTTLTDHDPHHELCPPGPDSWCKHRAAEAKGEPRPPHKYHLGRHVAAPCCLCTSDFQTHSFLSVPDWLRPKRSTFLHGENRSGCDSEKRPRIFRFDG
ncbi:hypothetical protein HPB52_006510 [Rhipicephalus sanguineus]|uniref:Uncharacterized protein n=1 Tax=Rhipicephalus sanguineus TaxID=34632 RepID=A0A9D4SW28_RHISA|nr:hypothetical protein HPB52_006510 [Rhipicephalus sanguineus]